MLTLSTSKDCNFFKFSILQSKSLIIISSLFFFWFICVLWENSKRDSSKSFCVFKNISSNISNFKKQYKWRKMKRKKNEKEGKWKGCKKPMSSSKVRDLVLISQCNNSASFKSNSLSILWISVICCTNPLTYVLRLNSSYQNDYYYYLVIF